MIITPKPIALNVLEKSDYTFYLTGSRHFGNYTIQSDWDFFTVHTPEIESFLVENGFTKELGSKRYQDASAVYIHYRDNVHVQLVSDVAEKMAAQELLMPFIYFLDKSQHSLMWHAVLTYVRSKAIKQTTEDLETTKWNS